MAFARYRDYALGDIDRTRQQQRLSKAISNQLLTPDTILKLPQLNEEVNKNLKTDLSTLDMLKIGTWAARLDADSIITLKQPAAQEVFPNFSGIPG